MKHDTNPMTTRLSTLDMKIHLKHKVNSSLKFLKNPELHIKTKLMAFFYLKLPLQESEEQEFFDSMRDFRIQTAIYQRPRIYNVLITKPKKAETQPSILIVDDHVFKCQGKYLRQKVRNLLPDTKGQAKKHFGQVLNEVKITNQYHAFVRQLERKYLKNESETNKMQYGYETWQDKIDKYSLKNTV